MKIEGVYIEGRRLLSTEWSDDGRGRVTISGLTEPAQLRVIYAADPAPSPVLAAILRQEARRR